MVDEQRSSPDGAPKAGRPGVPETYAVASATEGEVLPWAWAEDRLASSRNYWVVTVRPDGRPHAMPVWGVWMDGAFYFGTAPDSRKARNLLADPRACVHLESGDEVVVLEGVMAEVTATGDLRRIGEALSAKYGIEMDMTEMGAVVHRMVPAVAFGWTESSFPQNATRWVFDEAKPA